MADAYILAAGGDVRMALELAVADASEALARLATRLEIVERSVSFGFVYGTCRPQRRVNGQLGDDALAGRPARAP